MLDVALLCIPVPPEIPFQHRSLKQHTGLVSRLQSAKDRCGDERGSGRTVGIAKDLNPVDARRRKCYKGSRRPW